jgi:hypothetical protein
MRFNKGLRQEGEEYGFYLKLHTQKRKTTFFWYKEISRRVFYFAFLTKIDKEEIFEKGTTIFISVKKLVASIKKKLNQLILI